MNEAYVKELRAKVHRNYITYGKPITSDEVEFVANAPAIVDLLTQMIIELRTKLEKLEN